MNVQTRRTLSRAARRGFTLLEIIVVVTIIALLATLVAPKLLQNIWKSKQKVAQAEVASIAQQIGIYLADNGLSRPPEDMDLSVLTTGPSAALDPDDLIDPWGRTYVLVVPGEHNNDFDVISYGGDGEPGGDGEDADVWN
jgi:general secretion pathway protein G